MQASMDTETVRERLDELGEELQTVTSLVHRSIKNQQHEGVDDAEGAFDCSGDAERRFQTLKGEVQTLTKVVDSNGSSLASLTAGSLLEVNRLADQASRCKSAVGALDGLCQAEQFLTSSQQLLAKYDYVQAADAIARAEVLLGDLQQAEIVSAKLGNPGVGGRNGVNNKENRRDAPGCSSGVLRALKRLLFKRRAGLESHLRDVANASVELGKDGTTIRCRKVLSGYLCERYTFLTPVPLSAVFDALGKLGQLDALFSEMSDGIRRGIVDPLLSPRHVPPPKIGQDTGNLTVEELQGTWQEGGEGAGLVAGVLARVSVVLEFVHEEVLGGEIHLTAALGARLLSGAEGLSKALLAKLEDYIPHDAKYLANFEIGARDTCRGFEAHLASMGYFGDEACGAIQRSTRGSLTRFVETIDGRYAAKRRRLLLQEARDMALGDYHNSVEVSDKLESVFLADSAATDAIPAKTGGKGGRDGDDLQGQTFRLEACQVSTVAKSLVSLVRRTLTEACSDQVPPHCAKELFRTARDMLDLFRAVVPVQHANALDGVPRIAAVFQNDCLYLAHHMVTLGHEFRQGLPPPANETATFIDTVPLFRELAAQSLSEQQRKQQRQLREFFDGVDVLTSTESSSIGAAESTFEGMFAGDRTQSVPRVASGGGINRGWMAAGGSRIPTEAEYGTGTGDEGGAAAAVRKSVYHLRQLKQAWCKVLPDRVYKRVMGALLSLVTGKVCTPVIGAADLGEEQTHTLHRIFKTLAEAAQDIFITPAETEHHTPGWTKATVVAQMMELSLEAIGEMLQGEAFQPLSSDELNNLVRAIFQDTPSRAAVLAAIGQS